MSRLPCLLSALALSAFASAQTITVPNGTAFAEGNSSNTFPWGANSTTIPGLHVQCVYDSTNFTAQGVTSPIVITRLRWRANGTTSSWVGGTYAAATVALSTAPIDWSAITSTFASNEGADKVVCYSGPVQFLAGTGNGTSVPGPTVVDVTLTTPFVYNPTLGDLVIDADHLLGANFTANGTGTDRVALDVQTTGAASARAFASSNYPAPNGVQTPSGTVVTIDYAPANGLFAGFAASTTRGPSPLTVNFTDSSFSSDAGGITSWSWDFNGDSVIDSTAQNPSFTYTGCGNFNVSLTVTDASHAPSTLTRNNFIVTDEITANFTMTQISTNVIQLTDTSSPPATAWSWDFNGDNIPDSTAQNPVTAFPLCSTATVSLTATRNCRSNSITKSTYVASNELTTTFGANNVGSSGWVVMSDFNVTNPCGINICAIDHNASSTTTGTPFTFEVYLTPGSYVGKDNDITQWRLVATGSAFTAGSGVPSVGPLTAPLHLPFGSFGVAVRMIGASVRYSGSGTGGSPGVYNNSDLTITTGAARSTLFNGGSFFSIRQWNGRVHYDTCQTGGMPGMGWFGGGCAGTMPVSQQTVNTLPTPGGNLVVTWNNLPYNFAAAVVGFSNTLFQGSVPLPVDLAPIGAPGCPLRISDDMEFLQYGANNQTTLSVSVPNNPALLCLNFYTQAAVADTVNAFGFVLSEAWAGTVGQ